MILAAGSSSRMNGQSKQLLEFRGKTLLRLAAEIAAQSNFAKIVAVLNAESKNSSEEINGLPVIPVINENAKSGIGSSIRSGLSALDDGNLDAAIVMLCDQPLITPAILRRLADAFFQTGRSIVACRYENTVGVPALFARAHFAELSGLSGDEGAKKIIEKYNENVALVDAPEAGLDIDTLEDYRKLKQ